MPSMWKKQKGNKLSRLVADLQTTPKRGGSLVVETGFPTSIADLFVKNHDKLKKSSKKKHRSKQPPPSPSTPTPLTPSLYDQPSPVSDSTFSLSRLDVPSCSIDEQTEEFVAHMINSDLHAEEIVSRRNPRVEFNRDYCNYDDEIQDQGGNWRIPNSKKARWLLVLKGVLVVAVGIYTKSFVLGISIGAFLFCVLEYLGNSVLGFCRPCEDVRRKLRIFSPSLGASKPSRLCDKRTGKKPQEGYSNGAFDIGIKRGKGGGNGVVSMRSMKPNVEIIVPPKREIELGVRNEHVSRRAIELKDGQLKDGHGVASKDEMEQGNVTCTFDNGNFHKLEEDFQNKTICEIETFEPSSCESSCSSPLSYELRGFKGAMENGVEGSECSELGSHNGKAKKGKKFWGKFVPKQSKKKKNKHRKGKHQASEGPDVSLDGIDEISHESEEGNEQEDEQEMSVREAASMSLSLRLLDEQEREGVEYIGVTSHSNTEMLHVGEGSTKSSRMIKRKRKSLKCLVILGIALAGLTGGRVFALILTVICCLMFKIVRG